jgi:hypothetical protein
MVEVIASCYLPIKQYVNVMKDIVVKLAKPRFALKIAVVVEDVLRDIVDVRQ